MKIEKFTMETFRDLCRPARNLTFTKPLASARAGRGGLYHVARAVNRTNTMRALSQARIQHRILHIANRHGTIVKLRAH